MRAKILAATGVLVLVAVVGIAWAQSVPQLINYQGRLTDSAGMPLADGATVDLTFAFYGAATGDTAYLTVLQEDVMVTGGVYNVLIGSGAITAGTESSLAATFQQHGDVWLGVKVDADSEMTPRARITSVPYAMAVDINNLDLDGDGHYKPGSSNTPNDDCDDTSSITYPGANEICSDGIDNNCDGDVDAADSDCIPPPPGMARIPSGCFDMGDHFSEGASDELPVHNVCITSSFYMDLHEVTNAEYAACASGGGCTAPLWLYSYSRATYYGDPTYDNFPVIYVSWTQATAYCTWAGKRLPTEAEWEYAARGGPSGKRYPWGDSVSCAQANYNGCTGDTSEVESYAANGYGLYDVGGNVWEWVNDWHLSTYYSISPTNDPPGPASGTNRVLRGGRFGGVMDYLRVAYRDPTPPAVQGYGVGFRCAGD